MKFIYLILILVGFLNLGSCVDKTVAPSNKADEESSRMEWLADEIFCLKFVLLSPKNENRDAIAFRKKVSMFVLSDPQDKELIDNFSLAVKGLNVDEFIAGEFDMLDWSRHLDRGGKFECKDGLVVIYLDDGEVRNYLGSVICNPKYYKYFKNKESYFELGDVVHEQVVGYMLE